MRQGSGKIDPVNLIVIFENGSDKVRIDIPELGWEDGHKLEWVRAEVSLKGITVNKDTKICHYADAVGSRNSQPLVPRQYQNIRTDQTLITGTLTNGISR